MEKVDEVTGEVRVFPPSSGWGQRAIDGFTVYYRVPAPRCLVLHLRTWLRTAALK